MGKKSRKEKKRTDIPAETERQVLVEAGYRCSVPRCPSDGSVEIHHIDYDASNHDPANLLIMCPNCHRKATDRKIDRKACLMMKQQLSLKGASKPELEEVKDEIIAEIRNAVGSQETPKPLEDKDRGTQRPNGRIEAAAEQVLTFDRQSIETPADVLRPLAASFYHSGELNAAVEIQRVLVKSASATPTDHFNLGALLKDTGHEEEAESAYRMVLRADPRFALAWAALGGLLYSTGRMKEAEEACRSALAVDDKCVEALYNLGVLLHHSDRNEEAAKQFRIALELDPKCAAAWNNLGVLLYDTGRKEEAEQAYRRAVQLDPRHTSAWSNLGRLLQETDRKEEAAEAREKAIEAGAHNADEHSGLAYLLWECGRYDDAELEVMEALKDDPNHAYAHATLGLIRFEQDKLDEGRAGYEKAIEVKPDDLPLRQKYHYEYGRALARNKRPDDARREFEAALAVNADYVPRDQIETALSALA